MWRAAVLAALVACTPAAHAGGPPPPPCRQATDAVLRIDGEIDGALRDCVRAALRPRTRTVIVDSPGGSADAALDIAELIAPLRAELRIDGLCGSSCANYLVPVARRVTLEPGALIVMHGSIDARFVDANADGFGARRRFSRDYLAAHPGARRAEAEAAFEQAAAETRALAVRQLAFMERYRVRPGWMLYRAPRQRDVSPLFEGRPRLVPGAGRAFRAGWAYLVVEEPMVRSCLPDVEIGTFQAVIERDFKGEAARMRKAADAAFALSDDARCRDVAPARLPPAD